MMLWPPLPYEEWNDTRDTLHMQLQVIGKVRLVLSPLEPQCANVPVEISTLPSEVPDVLRSWHYGIFTEGSLRLRPFR